MIGVLVVCCFGRRFWVGLLVERVGPLIGPRPPPPYQRLEVDDHLTVPDTPRSYHIPLLLYLCTYVVTEHILRSLLCAFHPHCDQNPDLLSAALSCLGALAWTAFSIIDIARKIRSEQKERLQSRPRVSLKSSSQAHEKPLVCRASVAYDAVPFARHGSKVAHIHILCGAIYLTE